MQFFSVPGTLRWFYWNFDRPLVRFFVPRVFLVFRAFPGTEVAPTFPRRLRALEASRSEYRNRFDRFKGPELAEAAFCDFSAEPVNVSEVSEALWVVEAEEFGISAAARAAFTGAEHRSVFAAAVNALAGVIYVFRRFFRIGCVSGLVHTLNRLNLVICAAPVTTERVCAAAHAGEPQNALSEERQSLCLALALLSGISVEMNKCASRVLDRLCFRGFHDFREESDRVCLANDQDVGSVEDAQLSQRKRQEPNGGAGARQTCRVRDDHERDLGLSAGNFKRAEPALSHANDERRVFSLRF